MYQVTALMLCCCCSYRDSIWYAPGGHGRRNGISSCRHSNKQPIYYLFYSTDQDQRSIFSIV